MDEQVFAPGDAVVSTDTGGSGRVTQVRVFVVWDDVKEGLKHPTDMFVFCDAPAPTVSLQFNGEHPDSYRGYRNRNREPQEPLDPATALLLDFMEWRHAQRGGS